MAKRAVIKAARKKNDVRICHPRFLNIDSTKNQFKIHMSGEGTVTFDAAGVGEAEQRQYVDIVHNLGYQPAFKMWAGSDVVDWKEGPAINAGTTGPTGWISGMSRIDENTIRIYFYIWDFTLDPYDSFDVDYKYIVYVDPNTNAWSR